ncbi:hypothetical protein HEK616_56930 [Streptomyces nigrescens]|uniref:Secreted protein n=1 Tax=Streptomyces nigrescens TaxID=1920 RepID=A0ABN6R5P6_STRNI|nr:hypothetical protein HEK616_56930 [Streptomyces nigrescens]
MGAVTGLRGRLCGLLTLYVHTTGPSGPSPPVGGKKTVVGVHVTSTCPQATDDARPQPAQKLPLTGGAGPEDEVWRAGTAPDNTTPAARRNGETTRGGTDGYVGGLREPSTHR